MYFAEEEEAFNPTSHEESLGDFQEVLEINQQQKVGVIGLSLSPVAMSETRMREKVSESRGRLIGRQSISAIFLGFSSR
jgi:hypothetical protein